MFKSMRVFVLAVLVLALPLAAQARDGLPQFTNLARDAGKAVVNIYTVKTVGGGKGQMGKLQDFFRFHGPGQDSPFEDFFDQFNKMLDPRNQQQQTFKQRALGSGFIISSDGYIVTNNHVIADADEIKVKIQETDKEDYTAKIIGRDPETDLALLKIEAKKTLPTLKFADSDKIEVGEWVLAIGNPFGLGHTVTAGILSAKGRVIGAGPFDNFLQTDASINPGNSGGPLLNMDGQVVGVNAAIIASGSGIGFAIPSTMANKVIEQLRTSKKVSRGWLGVTIQDVDENTAKALGLSEPTGALVSTVLPGDPADQAGIKTSDVILEVNGKSVASSAELTQNIAGLAPGEKAKLVVWRKGGKVTLTATLGERNIKQTAEAQGKPQKEEAADEMGLSLRPVEKDQEAKALGLEKPVGLLVTSVLQGSAAAENGMRPGDVILEINQQPVSTVAAFRKVLESEGKAKGVVMLLVKRQGQNVFRTIPLDAKQ